MGMLSKVGVRRLSAVLGIAFAVGWATAVAQVGAAPAAGQRGETVDMNFQQGSNLSAAEQTAWAEEKSAAIVATREYVGRLLARERQAARPDIVRTNCLNNKLMEINAEIGNFEDRRTALRESISMGDDDRRLHEYRVLVVIYQRIQSLRAEAEACIGEVIGYMGEPQVTVIPPDDGGGAIDLTEPQVPDPYLDRPPHGSGYY